MVPCPEHPVSKPDPSAPFQFCLDIANNPYVYANNTGGDFSVNKNKFHFILHIYL